MEAVRTVAMVIGVVAIVAVLWKRPADVFLEDDPSDWTPPPLRRPLDRAALLDLPYSPFLTDDEALAMARDVRRTLDQLPEVAA